MARRPRDLPVADWKQIAQGTVAHLKRDRVSVSAGSLAYHGFLAFFPAIIAALGILTLIHIGGGTLHHLTNGIDRALPAGAAGVFKGAVRAAAKRQSPTMGAAIVGITVALWSSSSAMAVLQQTLDVAYEVPTDRKFLARRARGIVLMALTVALGGCAAALIVFGQPIGSAIDGNVPVGGVVFEAGWTALRWVVGAAVVAVLFSMYYGIGPNRKTHWRWITPGSVLATVVFLAASLGFSYYISTFGSYGKTYGSFAGVAIFIFWLYLTGFAVLLGGELNAEVERRRPGHGLVATARATARSAEVPSIFTGEASVRRREHVAMAGEPQAQEGPRQAQAGE